MVYKCPSPIRHPGIRHRQKADGEWLIHRGRLFRTPSCGDAVLDNAGQISAEIAKQFAESEFEKFRVIQDRLFESDFDRFDSLLNFPDYY